MPPLSRNRPAAAPTPVARAVRKALATVSPPKGTPPWAGPAGAGPTGGVTSSLLRRYLRCKERFRVYALLGLDPARAFDHKLFYGNLWHECERALAAAPPTRAPQWEHALADYARREAAAHPLARQQIEHWARTCQTQFPLYVEHWARHPDVKDRRPLLQEQPFDVWYRLPSGRQVRLRGKWDAVDLIGKGRAAGVWVQENKTKADIREGRLKRQLTWDLQTMLYLVALGIFQHDQATDTPGDAYGEWGHSILGVRYNVVRRPFGGGKGSIVRHKPTKKNPLGESADAFYARLAGVIRGDMGHFFLRLQVPVQAHDLDKFRRQCLDPVLENLLDDWEWWDFCRTAGAVCFDGEGRHRAFPAHTPRHFRFPFGVLNTIDEAAGSADVDEFLETGGLVGLQRISTVFPELI